jgi:hypothetical protein
VILPNLLLAVYCIIRVQAPHLDNLAECRLRLPPLARTAACGFARKGGRFVWAEAKIDGEEILVFSPEIAEPRSARYGLADNPEVKLCNKAAFPPRLSGLIF